jgi:hypothetical protein
MKLYGSFSANVTSVAGKQATSSDEPTIPAKRGLIRLFQHRNLKLL